MFDMCRVENVKSAKLPIRKIDLTHQEVEMAWNGRFPTKCFDGFVLTCSVQPGRCSTLTIIIIIITDHGSWIMDHIYIYILKVHRHGISKIRNPSAILARSNVRVAPNMFWPFDRASPEKSRASSLSPAGLDLQTGSTRQSPASGKPETNRAGHRSQHRWNVKVVPLGYHLLSNWPWKIRSQRWGSASPTNTNTLQALDSWIKVLWVREKVALWHNRWRQFYCRTTLWCPQRQTHDRTDCGTLPAPHRTTWALQRVASFVSCRVAENGRQCMQELTTECNLHRWRKVSHSSLELARTWPQLRRNPTW